MANMKNRIRTITITGLAGAGMLAVLLCSGCAKTPEPQPEAVSEVSEIVSEVETVEISEVPSEEISEVAPVAVELPELPILDENGEAYIPDMFTEEEIYAAIERMEPYCGTDFERDQMVGMILYYNCGLISDELFDKVSKDYLANFDTKYMSDYVGDYERKLFHHENKVPISALLIDENESQTLNTIETIVLSENPDADAIKDFYYNYLMICNEENVSSLYVPLLRFMIAYGYFDADEMENRGLNYDDFDAVYYYAQEKFTDYGSDKLEKIDSNYSDDVYHSSHEK